MLPLGTSAFSGWRISESRRSSSEPLDYKRNMSGSVRLDKWLWATRFFKTRSLATKACAAGKVKRSGSSLKPAATVQAGDVLEVPFHEGPGARTITVTAILEKRVCPAEAGTAYLDLTPDAVLEVRRFALANRVGSR